MGSSCRMVLQKRKLLFQTSRGWHTVSASALMYMDFKHAVMLKPASVHFTFISDYEYLMYLKKKNKKKTIKQYF